MEPEEIDKLFKDRLGNLPAMPSADAWMRLQQKMEPPKKTRSMWIYYAAASVTLLLVAGFWFFSQPSNLNNGTLATANKPESTLPAPVKKDAPLIITPPKIKTPGNQLAQAEETKPIVKLKTVAQPPVKVKKTAAANAQLLAEAKKPKKANKIKANENALPPANTPALPASEPEELLAQVNPEQPANASALTANVVEVRIKRDETDEAARSDLRENLARKTSLLKNIYKQARNLKNGEQIELAALGINTEKISSETKEIKEKINKIIPL